MNLKNIALKLAHEIGTQNITKVALCERAGIVKGSFHHTVGESFTNFIQSIPMVGPTEQVKPRSMPLFRKRHILRAAVELAWSGHYALLTAASVAEAAKITPGLLYHYFKTMGELKTAVMGEAIRTECIEIIAQGLVSHDKRAKSAPKRLKEKAAEYVRGL